MSMAAGSIAARSVKNPTYSITNPIGNQVNEGTAWDFFITTTNVNPGIILYWTIDFNNSTNAADFAVTTGSLTLSSNPNNNQFVVFFLADSLTEGAQTFKVDIRTGSNTGPIVVSSNLITINDTSR